MVGAAGSIWQVESEEGLQTEEIVGVEDGAGAAGSTCLGGMDQIHTQVQTTVFKTRWLEVEGRPPGGGGRG